MTNTGGQSVDKMDSSDEEMVLVIILLRKILENREEDASFVEPGTFTSETCFRLFVFRVLLVGSQIKGGPLTISITFFYNRPFCSGTLGQCCLYNNIECVHQG